MQDENQHKKKDEKIEEHKKSTKASSAKTKGGDSTKKVEKTGTKDDDWNDPTGNSHLGSS